MFTFVNRQCHFYINSFHYFTFKRLHHDKQCEVESMETWVWHQWCHN